MLVKNFRLYLKTPSPKKFSRKYLIVSCKVSCGSRVVKFNSSSAFAESKYQKYSPISTSDASNGAGLFQFL